MDASTDRQQPRILLTTWRRTGRLWGAFERDVVGVEMQYIRAVQRAGGVALLAPIPEKAQPDDAVAMLAGFDGLLLIGGEDLAAEVSGVDPATVGTNASVDRDRWEMTLTHAALAAGLPVLGICRGLQLLAVALGGSLCGDIADSSLHHPQVPDALEPALQHRHEVKLVMGSRVARAYGKTRKSVNSLHHQAIRSLGDGLVVSALAPDGIIEAVETAGEPWCVGVQWHPELMPEDSDEAALLATFVAECAR